jgi:hypothetical protein
MHASARVLSLALAACSQAEDRAARIHRDRASVVAAGQWLYDDLEQGFALAEASGKPLLVVLRCIPCEACRGFDEQVAELDPRLSDLLERFVRVRVPKANGLDLSLFQVDWDLSFSAVFLRHDRTIYGRFGSRTTQQDERGDVSVAAFREALEAVLDLHARFATVRDALAAKSPGTPRFAVPEEYPMLAQFEPHVDWEGKVVESCIHCHQVREAERELFRARGEAVPARALLPWPEPAALGLELDPARRARVAGVAPGSAAAAAGFLAGDELLSLAGQPLVSSADACWVLEHAPETGTLAAVVRRGGEEEALALPLAPGWRLQGDLSWRASTWDLRRRALGGMHLVEASESERAALGLGADRMALVARHVGEYGDHGVAHRHGVRKGDVVVAVDGKSERRSEAELFAHALEKPVGARIEYTLRRGADERVVGFAVK